MRKFALALMATAAMVFGFGAVANAYPPGAPAADVSTATPAPGATFTVTVVCAPPGGEVTLVFNGATFTAPCEAAGAASIIGNLLSAPATGTATFTLTAPTEPGVYTGTYSGAAVGSFTVTVAAPVVPGGGLPATGSDSTSTMTMIAIGLFAIGAGLFGVSQVRRRTALA